MKLNEAEQHCKLLSVVIPAYNAEKFLAKCVASIAEQIYKNIEIIIVNNGSQDNTPKICEELEAKYNNIKFKIINLNPNQGINYARRAGVENASGEYIAFIDSDDYLEPETYGTAIKILEANNCDIVQFGIKRVNLNVKILGLWRRKDMTINNSQEIYKYFLTDKIPTWNVWDKVYKREIFNNLIWPKVSALEDYCMSAQIFAKAQKIMTINKLFYNYVQHPGSTMRLNSVEQSKCDEGNTSLAIVMNLTQNKFPDLLPEAIARKILFTANADADDYKLMKAELKRQGRSNILLELSLKHRIYLWLSIHCRSLYKIYLRTRLKIHALTGI